MCDRRKASLSISRVIFLDAGPLSLACQRKGKPEAEKCRAWIKNHTLRGVVFVVAEITDYEARRELLRAGNNDAIARLDRFVTTPPLEFVTLNTSSIRRAAELWAKLRKEGQQTADPKELDCDVVLVAQILTSVWSESEIVVATTNVGHLSRMLTADLWENIVP